jgi:hypothetical protein
MSKPNEPMFKMLLETLKDESEATKAMFYTGKESDLLRAYQEGSNACLSSVPVSKNPYPLSAEDVDSGKYNMNSCWNEGYVNTFIENEE